MFKRKNKELTRSVSMPTPCPHQNLEPEDYYMSPLFVNYTKSLKKTCKRRLKTGSYDQFCFDYMDEEINRVGQSAKYFLLEQQAKHQAMIHTLVFQFDKADQNIAQCRLEQLKKEKEEIQKELDKYNRILYRKTTLEKVGDAR